MMERELALEILLKYKKENSYLNLTLNTCFERISLTQKQKDFITRLVYSTVQNQIYLEYILKHFVKMRVKAFEKMLILMSLSQHIFFDSIPDYAIVNEANNIAKKKKGKKTAQFINAVLKNALNHLPPIEGNDLEDFLLKQVILYGWFLCWNINMDSISPKRSVLRIIRFLIKPQGSIR